MEKSSAKPNAILINGTEYPSLASACRALNTPRQQTKRHLDKIDTGNQMEVDALFNKLSEHYSSQQQISKAEVGKKFGDGRVSPIRYKRGLFRSKAHLAKHLNVRVTPFRTRLNFLEITSVSITDNIIEACTRPLFHSSLKVATIDTMLSKRLSGRYKIDVGDKKLESLLSSDLINNCSLPTLAVIFNVDYETLKRTCYDIKLNKNADAKDKLTAICFLHPKGIFFEGENNSYMSIVEFMVKHSYKLTTKNANKLISVASSTIS